MVLTAKGRKRLATIMIVQDLSQRQLAAGIGWKSHTYLGRLLRGEEENVSPEAAARIAEYLGVGMDDFFVPRVSSGTGRVARQQRTAAA